MFPCWENKSDDFGTKKNGVQVEKPNQAIYISFWYCQALSISQSLNLSLSLRDRDRADTIITLYHQTTPPPPETF